MIKITHSAGKDAALSEQVAKLKQKLLNYGINIVEDSCLNPVDNIWSISVSDRECPVLNCSGYGASKNAAMFFALSRFIQQLTTHHFWSDYYLGDEVANSKFVHSVNEVWFAPNTSDSFWPEGVLDNEFSESEGTLRELYNPDGELNISRLIDMNSSNLDRGICCVPYRSIRTGEIVNFPVNIIDNIYSCNGIGSGDTIHEARLDALCEVIANYIQFKVISEGISLPNIPDGILSRYPSLLKSIQDIEKLGLSVFAKEASLGGQYPVLAMILVDPKNQGVYSNFAAHPDFEVAFERSLTGLFQDRDLEHLDGFLEAGFDMDEMASPNNLEAHFKRSQARSSNGRVPWLSLNDKPDFDFVAWDKQVSIKNYEEEFHHLCDLVHADGNEVFICEHGDIGLNICRIIAPGMSEIYPVDRLVLENNNAGMDVREQILKKEKSLAECEQLIQDLEELNQDDYCLVSTLIGMAADTDSIFHDLCVAELITLLALKVQDNERIQEGCEWLLHFKQLNPRRLKTYHCINTILQLDTMTSYAITLEKLYTKEILSDALALIDGEDVFPLVSKWKMHGLLVDAYVKVNETRKK